MGAAAYNRGSKLIREQLDRETARRQPEADRAAEYENTFRRAERLAAELDVVRAELNETKRALARETAEHQKTIAQAEQRDERHYLAMASLRRSYSEISEKLFSIKPLTKHEAMLLVCDDGRFVLVHPGAGGLAEFASLDDARQWATHHDGFIPQRADYHAFHGAYYRVGFNLWPKGHP